MTLKEQLRKTHRSHKERLKELHAKGNSKTPYEWEEYNSLKHYLRNKEGEKGK